MRPAPLWRRYDRLLGSDPAADVKDELRFHLETKVDDLIARGWSPEDARKEAESQFGNIRAVQRVGERMGEHMDRRRRLTDYFADALHDLRFTLRTLRRDHGFMLVAVLILTLGIGANIAVFSVVNTILLRPCPSPMRRSLSASTRRTPKPANPPWPTQLTSWRVFNRRHSSSSRSPATLLSRGLTM